MSRTARAISTGLSADKPKIGRFGYAEKMEYWAVVWGTIIMGVTGLMIWFKMDVTQAAALGGGRGPDDSLLRSHPRLPGHRRLAFLPRHLRSGCLSAELGLLGRQGVGALAGGGTSARPGHRARHWDDFRRQRRQPTASRRRPPIRRRSNLVSSPQTGKGDPAFPTGSPPTQP